MTPPDHPAPSPADLQAALNDLFAPWVQDLDLRVEAAPEPGVVLARLPVNPRLAREGGTLCGQAMLSAADTVMVLALIHHFKGFRPCTTVQQSSSFLRPLSGQDLRVEARVLRAGKTLAFGEIDLRGADDGRSVCRISSTCALL